MNVRPFILVAVVAVTAQAASARRREVDFRPFKRAFVCPSNTQWKQLRRCIETRETQSKLTLVRDRPNVKLVKRTGKHEGPLLAMYMRVSGTWMRTTFYGDLDENSELLDFVELADGEYRIEMGYRYPTTVTVDDVTTNRALLRRKITTVCTDNGTCQSIISSCDVSVRGKTYWMFRGDVVWDGTRLRVKGDAAYGGKYCQVPASQLVPEETR